MLLCWLSGLDMGTKLVGSAESQEFGSLLKVTFFLFNITLC